WSMAWNFSTQSEQITDLSLLKVDAPDSSGVLPQNSQRKSSQTSSRNARASSSVKGASNQSAEEAGYMRSALLSAAATDSNVLPTAIGLQSLPQKYKRMPPPSFSWQIAKQGTFPNSLSPTKTRPCPARHAIESSNTAYRRTRSEHIAGGGKDEPASGGPLMKSVVGTSITACAHARGVNPAPAVNGHNIGRL